jgi:Predicted membrane protein
LAQWLSKEDNAAVLSGLAVKLAGHGIGALRDERVRQFVRSTALARLEEVDLAKMSGQLLEVLTDDGRAQEVLDAVLNQVDISLQGEAQKNASPTFWPRSSSSCGSTFSARNCLCTTLLATGHRQSWSSESLT